jgi:aconitate hydratase
MTENTFSDEFGLNDRKFAFYNIQRLRDWGFSPERLPYSIRVLLENLLRKMDGKTVTEGAVRTLAGWKKKYEKPVEIPFHPARVLMQDFTGVPAVVDLAAMRDVVKEHGKNPELVNPLVPVDLVVDHSVQVDVFGSPDALEKNVEKEYERNRERYMVLKWAQGNFDNLNVVPPNSGICHQVNLEYLARVVMDDSGNETTTAYPDTLVGTDSHTPMINGLGVLGWGVGGIEAEAVLLGQPYYMPIPEVVGVRLSGRLGTGVTTTDLVLTVTEILRSRQVVGKFVEFFGEGMKRLSVPDRATLANMTPEYGATVGFFPVDARTIDYLCETNRGDRAELVEAYTRKNMLFNDGSDEPDYSDIVDVDLTAVEPCLAGPSRPQDRIPLKNIKAEFQEILNSGGDKEESSPEQVEVELDLDGRRVTLSDGSVVIAAITSCTNTSNPYVMLAAGLVAKRAAHKGLKPPASVKTSLAPGSKVVMRYLECAGLIPYLENLGFHLTAYGCTTCIGNSGPLHPSIEDAITQNRLNVAAVLSGNRNFEARVHQRVRSNFLASPPLVVAFALAGRIDVDFDADPLGMGVDGDPVYLRDVWPEADEIEALAKDCLKAEFYDEEYGVIFEGDKNWRSLPVPSGAVFAWDDGSTYIRRPPFFQDFQMESPKPEDIIRARTLLLLGDTLTTDHISPAGAIPEAYPAGRYLMEKNVPRTEFNSYGSRRGNHEVMMRGTFANVRIKNRLTTPKEGGWTIKFPEGEETTVFEAAMAYQAEKLPLLVLAGKEYGTGSSRDWAAKGTQLLGVRAVIAKSFERIHRSNLVGMGVLPLVFQEGAGWDTLGLEGGETFSITELADMQPGKTLTVGVKKRDGTGFEFPVTARLDTEIEVEYFKHAGILPYVLRRILRDRS